MKRHRVITPRILYFGTPVVVISSTNADGTTNLAPISSYFALADLIVIGLGSTGQTARNLRERPEMVLNFLTEDHWATIETLGELTGASPVPPEKPQTCQYEPDKFSAAGWSALPSESVRPHRVAEASVHVEARVTSMDPELQNLLVVRARSSVVHADEGIVIDGTSYVDPLAWRPLIYSFRHYFGLGERVGIAGPAEVRR